jgi:hypothetical protein
MEAFDYLTIAIRHFHDCGSFALMLSPLAVLATIFDRLRHLEPAATISGFAATPFTRTASPEINTAITHLREVLGDEAYESFARKGENMTNTAMATYALNQIDRARTELEQRADSRGNTKDRG